VLEARCSQGPVGYRVQSNLIKGKKGKVNMGKKRRGEGKLLNSTPLVLVSWICFILGNIFVTDLILRFVLLSVARVLPQVFQILLCHNHSPMSRMPDPLMHNFINLRYATSRMV